MKAVRVTFLLGVLAVVVMWGLRLHRRHAHRNEWKRPLEVALVLVSSGVAGDDDISLELTACAHELLHCLGASDKYDAEGHATAAGIVEPDAAPRFPQKYAEPMVGEVPLGPANGRVPRSLAEVRIGPVTASEVGWTP